jgi:hypothetical protein
VADKKEKLMQLCLEIQRENPGITKEELKRILLERYSEKNEGLPEDSAQVTELGEKPPESIPEISAAQLQSENPANGPGTSNPLRELFAKRWAWVRLRKRRAGIVAGIALFCVVVGMAGYKEHWFFRVPNVGKPISQDSKQLSYPLTAQEKKQFTAKIESDIAKEGAGVFLGKLAVDAVDDTDIIAVKIRLMEIDKSNADKYKANIEKYIRHRKLVTACLVKNNTIQWPPDELPKYDRIKAMFNGSDKQVDMLYQALMKKDFPAMERAVQEIQKSNAG